MDARFHDDAVLFPPDEIRDLVKTVYDTAKCHLENRRKEKIFLNLRKAAKCEEPFSATDALLEGAVLAMQSLSSIGPRSATMDRVDRAPNGLAWVRVSTNLKAPDNYKDKFFVPYVGESDAQQSFSNAVAADADLCPAEHYAEDDISDVENTIRVTPVEGPDSYPGKQMRTVKRRLQKHGESRAMTTRHGKTRGKKSSEIVWNRAARRVALEQVMKKLRLRDIRSVASIVKEVFGTHSLAEIESCYKNVMYRRKAYKESDDEALLRAGQKGELLAQLKGTVQTQPGEALRGDSIPFFFCRQCYIYNCLEHGTQTAKPVREPPDRTKKDTATRQGVEDIESRCPDRQLCRCSCISYSTENAEAWWRQVETNKELRDNLKSIVLELFASFGNDPCRISELGRLFVLDHDDNRLTCHRVGYLLKTLEETNLKNKQSRCVARRPKKKYRTKAPRGETESMKGGQRVDYAPCQHDGPCTAKSCRCVENGVNCEKYCSCNHNRTHGTRPDKRLPCNHAFQGCTCRSAVACISNACVCYSYGRECDPDLCRACHDCRDSDRGRSCRNVGLLMGERQRTVVGHSETHGWGAFAANDVSRGEIIGEYVGEVVSHVDADRRGRLYDEIDYSFLFNITEDWALDSTRLGNKLRYCNHHFKPNCAAKLMRVGGDVRVGLYAVRDIGKHEELFFDYKYKNGPAWSMPGSDGNSGSSRSKQEYAKKRAPAVGGDDDDEEEVIPVPKKRTRSEPREVSLPRQIPDVARYANMNDVNRLNLVTEGAAHLNARNPNGTRSDSFQGGSALIRDMDSANLADKGLLCDQNITMHESEACNAKMYEVVRSGDDIDQVFTSKERRYPVPRERLLRSGDTTSGIELPEEKSRRRFPGELKTSDRKAQLNYVPPDSRANSVIAINSIGAGDYDFRKRRQNGENRENHNTSNGLSNDKQRLRGPQTLRDVFGSDLESLDEKGNQSAHGSARADAMPNRNSVKSTPSLLNSAPAPSTSSDSSGDTEKAHLARPSPAGSTDMRRTKDETRIPAGISKVRTHRRDNDGKTRHAHNSVNHRDYEVAMESPKVSGLTKFTGQVEERKLRSRAVKERSAVHKSRTRNRGISTETGLSSTLGDVLALQVPSGRAPSEVPHINLVSDDDEDLNLGSSEGTFSNYSNDRSKS